MAEPQPQGVHEGAEAPPAPTSAEDRKTAAALSSLDAQNETETATKQEVDTEALGKAMDNLNVKEEKKAETKKVVKVDAADVALLVEQLELPKAKATELLKSHDANPVKAMIAFVTASS
ncbi:hypothetical protein K490DRAFT_64413 [Saccharata proteae CBS 121410]|uniref:Nascent polypeptide-associated complex subunit alpha-like UBA domain-containing protein n=1 Tax=Saccharata proteae CBS 121410 TaxID=1314787 RepID=A0A6A5YCG2_9PEZI|nr:hypothetical protein K490DRAFT_64413 [Saccharata proteae CBS 121410]